MKTLLLILNMIFVITFTCHGVAPASSAEPDTLIPPERLHYAPLKFQIPRAEIAALANGIPLYIAEDHELPLVKLTALVRAGIAHDPSGKEGLADLVGGVLLTGGTQLLSGDEIDEALAFMAADIDCGVYLEYTLLTLSVLRKDLDRALEIFASILRNPVFEKEKFATAKNLDIEELRRIPDDPQNLAFRTYRKLLYRGDPRGRLSTLQSLERIARTDLLNYHRAHFTPGNILLSVSGDITGKEALSLLNRCLGDWQEINPGMTALPPPRRETEASLTLLPKETPQSVIIYGSFAPPISSPDCYPFTVLDFILGSGGFQSRMFQEIRTNRGLAYSSGSFYQARRDYGIFEAYVFTKAESTAQVLGLIKEIIREFQEKEVGTGELQWAKNAIANNFIFTFKTADDVALQQMMLEYKGLPGSFLEEYPDRIAAVGAEDVRRVAAAYLDPQKSVILVLGPEKEFDAPLSRFGTVNREDAF
ncbi:MAG: Peptidase M16 inactive domain protein [Syntrophus sp. PtaU1.Bin005]|jgi:predicted Zn-dependent peptidase|uniref:M16 family metallopeptidase n=1 Tax=Syntrophus sp. (in: bacteria) TaxID=48412 RepID=UPI0009D3E363|nr:MAG: Peptidase M16 inactive domain protein [Syntrophus sp. PtaB.Bin138]OPY83488.1 MAG: Peptidase M16 inactive domain protein [Syntrophus sp. PtaU1.Bin005]